MSSDNQPTSDTNVSNANNIDPVQAPPSQSSINMSLKATSQPSQQPDSQARSQSSSQPSQQPDSQSSSQPAAEKQGSMPTYNIKQACAIVREQSNCGDLKLETAYQITDGSAIEFIEAATGKQLASGRLRFSNSLFVDQNNGNISVPAFISDLSFFKSALNVKVTDPSPSEVTSKSPESASSQPSSPRTESLSKSHRVKKTGSAKLVKHNRKSSSQPSVITKTDPSLITADSLLDCVD